MNLPYRVTLLDLLQAVNECTTSDVETVAAVTYLINSGKVRLCGNFAGAWIDFSPSLGAVSQSAYSKNSRREIAGLLPQ
jgi:hypothetical protein